jgi:hypothetical protein
MAATEIRTIDQEAANTRRSHFAKRDFLVVAFCGLAAGTGGHAPSSRRFDLA